MSITEHLGASRGGHGQTEAVAIDGLLEIAHRCIEGPAEMIEDGTLEDLRQAASEIAADSPERQPKVHALTEECVEA